MLSLLCGHQFLLPTYLYLFQSVQPDAASPMHVSNVGQWSSQKALGGSKTKCKAMVGEGQSSLTFGLCSHVPQFSSLDVAKPGAW